MTGTSDETDLASPTKNDEMSRILLLSSIFLVSLFPVEAADSMNTVAERYAHLVLALGQHDPDYVDAFYGPAEWKAQAEKEKKSLDAIGAEAAELLAIIGRVGGWQASHSDAATAQAKNSDAKKSGDEMLKLRREYLQKQV